MSEIRELREEIKNSMIIEARFVIDIAHYFRSLIEELKKLPSYRGPINITQIDKLNAEIKKVETANNGLSSNISEIIKIVSQLNLNINTQDQSMLKTN